jgi:pyruvate dehydrogenase E2 component (dihydrolipoamide acetyltransferase)
MSNETLPVPDVGTDSEVEVVEILVSEGDRIEIDEPVVVLESDKASVEVPATVSGVIESLAVKVGDKVKTGDGLLTLKASADSSSEQTEQSEQSDHSGSTDDEQDRTESKAAKEQTAETKSDSKSTSKDASKSAEEETVQVRVPDLGGAEDVEVIEINVSENHDIEEDQAILVLESDKASMDIPSPTAGKITKLAVSVGDKVNQGDLILELSATKANPAEKAPSGQENAASETTESTSNTKSDAEKPKSSSSMTALNASTDRSESQVHAGPAVRKLARELGVDLERVNASGPKGRIQKDDLNDYIKAQVTAAQSGQLSGATGAAIELPDFSAFGEIEFSKLSKIQSVTARNMQASWSNVPHVTQFDEADITEMEAFRKAKKDEAQARDTKLTPVPFLLLACAKALQELPQFNVALDLPNQQLIHKKYIHIGLAVDTPYGLVVPVIRNVPNKSIWQLSKEVIDLADKAKNRKLSPQDMQGACFTISSLGGIGGTAFTPIVNMPEVAILGVSKAQQKPVYQDGQFVPRLMLPLSLSYDHRVVNGADGARFTSLLAKYLADLRELLF